MAESQRNVKRPEVYERLIDRLAVALETARTAGRLRNERPAELELRGLSRAEVELINAYLDQSQSTQSVSPVAPLEQWNAAHTAEVIWLKDRTTGMPPRKLGLTSVK